MLYSRLYHPPFSLASFSSSNSSRSRNSSRKRLLNDSLQPFSQGLPGATWIGSAPLPGSHPASASQTNSLPLSLRMLTGAPRLPITRASTPRTSHPVSDAATCNARHSLVYSSTKVSQRSGLPPAVRSATKSYAHTSFLNRAGLFKNDVWAYDFVADRTAGGKPLRWLTLVDEYTKECLALHVAASLTGWDVRGVLARVIGRRGAPVSIRSDNGSEFVCEALAGWLPGKGAEPIQVAPGSPWENGCSESFNSRFRDEFLEREEFEDEKDAREKGGWYRREYNMVRPHSSLDYKTPRQFSDECDAGLHGQPAKDDSEAESPLPSATHNNLSRSSIGNLDPSGRS